MTFSSTKLHSTVVLLLRLVLFSYFLQAILLRGTVSVIYLMV